MDLNKLRSRSSSNQAFTLVELLVVILIIGILLAIALPTFLGQQDRANDSKAQQSLSDAYKSAKAEATSKFGAFTTGSYSASSLASDIQVDNPELGTVQAGNLAATPAAGQGVEVLTSLTGVTATFTPVAAGKITSGADLLLATRSASGSIWLLQVQNNGAVQIKSQ